MINNKLKDILDKGKLTFVFEEKKLIKNIVDNEKSISVYKEKIFNEIENIRNDDSKYKIEHLKILLIGRKGVGKTTLIRYMLKIDDNEEIISESISDNCDSYKSRKVPHLKLIEFRGIGLDENNNPEIIGNEALYCIQNEINKNNNNNNNYKDFINCIWYWVSGTRFEEVEENLLQNLSKVYNTNIMPIIVIYTQAVDFEMADGMLNYIKKKFENISIIKILAKGTEIMNSIQSSKAFGDKELLNETLLKCTMALQGDMINIMTKTISDVIIKNLKKENEEKVIEIRKKIKDNFIKNYNEILTDEELKNYIVNLLGKNLFPFYENYNKKITNKSLNLIKKSTIINSIDDFIKYYQQKVEELINPILDEKAVLFIDKQATIEKKKENMKLEFKRNLNGFKYTTNIFLKRNFYYIAQKYIIIKVIIEKGWDFFSDYSKELDSIIDDLLKENKEIKNHLEDCFLTKLEKFSKEKGINIQINHPSISRVKAADNSDEKFDKKNIEQKSIELVDNFNFDFDDSEDNFSILPELDNIEENWYPFKKKKWKYLNENSQNSLNDFLNNNMLYQDSYFNKKDNDIVLNALKDYERNDLINFFESKKKYFMIEKINKEYMTKQIHQSNTTITQITTSKEFKEIYINRINNEVDKIKKDLNFCRIDYLSIIVMGRSGVGKSSLLNGMLKEDLAITGIGDKVTITDRPYKSKSIPFLRIYDTRGIELDKDYGPDKILQNIFDIIKKQKSNKKNGKDTNYNDYIQCIWYCVHSEMEEKEIEILNNLKQNEKSIPIIIVFTYAFDEQLVNKVEVQINEKCKDTKFVPVLAQKIKNRTDSFGLDNLLNETLKICKKAKKGNIFKEIREKSFDKIEKYLVERNKGNKIKACNKIVNIFTSYFSEILNDNEFNQFINYLLLENIFLEYLNSDNQHTIKGLSEENKNLLKGILTEFQDFYSKYRKYYRIKTEEIINPILEKYAVKYLNEQVKKEKKEFNQCLNNKNKSNKNDFKNIITQFLSYNFYYISQKYIIYRIITDVSESICEKIEHYINIVIKDILKQNNPDYLEEIYHQKFEELEQTINKYRKNTKIYYEKNENNLNINTPVTKINGETKKDMHKSEMPAPIPVNKNIF